VDDRQNFDSFRYKPVHQPVFTRNSLPHLRDLKLRHHPSSKREVGALDRQEFEPRLECLRNGWSSPVSDCPDDVF
jgi:hypothetical protein